MTTFDATYNASEGKKLDFSVFAKRADGAEYPRRVSGGRIYIREDGSNDEWVLLADISIKDGARATLEDEYFQWGLDGTGEYRITTGNAGQYGQDYWPLKSSKPSLLNSDFILSLYFENVAVSLPNC